MRALTIICLLLVVTLTSCQKRLENKKVITSDIDLFWRIYDMVIQENDSLKQIALIQKEYIEKGSAGLKKIIQARDYSAKEYAELINRYPKYWSSIRNNTLKAKNLSHELNNGIAKFKAIYPSMKPAQIYFTIGAMRTNGTVLDNLVLIGSELAMADEQTDVSEFKGRTKDWLQTYFSTNPIEGLVQLNIHEYVHTQQGQRPNNLLHLSLYEGIAEFVSVTAMNRPSDVPAIEFGKNNPDVRQTFENEMFYERVNQWLWSNATNKFNVRDLGYYIGYAMAEKFYEATDDKQEAIAELINLDYRNPTGIDKFIDGTKFFNKPINQLRSEFEYRRPTVIEISQFKNGSQSVDVKTDQLTIKFSKPMMVDHRNFEIGPLGEDAVVRFKKNVGYSENDTKYTFEIQELKPNKNYQLIIGSGFQDKDGVPLQPYLVEFKTTRH